MVTTLQVGKDDQETLRSEYERLTALGIDMEDAYGVEHWPGGWVKVYRYAVFADEPGGRRRYLDPETGALALAEPTWHRVTS